MDFTEPADLAAWREAARGWADANLRPEWADEQRRTGCHQTMELHARLGRDGILGAGWPAEYGGSDVEPGFARAVLDEAARRGVLSDGWATTAMVAHTIERVGTPEQKAACIPAALRGEMLIALGYSEPGSGSDVAAARTAAVRDGAEWVISGQKMFTSTAQLATHVFLLTRTSPDAAKHQGLTLFLVPTASAGFSVRPIGTLGGQVTTATFYDGVRVPDSARVGGADEGWGVMKVALVYERGFGAMASLEQTLGRDLAAWAREAGTLDDPLVAERIGRIAADEEVTRLLGLRLDWMARQGQLPVAESAMRKLFWTETLQRHCADALDVLGPAGVLGRDAPGAPGGGRFEQEFRAAVVTTVYGGASEVLRDIIAERRLGLPRSRPAGG
jgi:alkylation response protein AidB-like acyl-CoA dehydrogenase